ncbi:MAG: hypothetical protein HRT71_10225 [Flavobacteriales bacterium]|nr:hypothetical protein [Flavobacteriales bacterium]
MDSEVNCIGLFKNLYYAHFISNGNTKKMKLGTLKSLIKSSTVGSEMSTSVARSLANHMQRPIENFTQGDDEHTTTIVNDYLGSLTAADCKSKLAVKSHFGRWFEKNYPSSATNSDTLVQTPKRTITQFKSPAQSKMYRTLVGELRCLWPERVVCVAGSLRPDGTYVIGLNDSPNFAIDSGHVRAKFRILQQFYNRWLSEPELRNAGRTKQRKEALSIIKSLGKQGGLNSGVSFQAKGERAVHNPTPKDRLITDLIKGAQYLHWSATTKEGYNQEQIVALTNLSREPNIIANDREEKAPTKHCEQKVFDFIMRHGATEDNIIGITLYCCVTCKHVMDSALIQPQVIVGGGHGVEFPNVHSLLKDYDSSVVGAIPQNFISMADDSDSDIDNDISCTSSFLSATAVVDDSASGTADAHNNGDVTNCASFTCSPLLISRSLSFERQSRCMSQEDTQRPSLRARSAPGSRV